MADPLTALMYAVQVMKLLKSLTEKTVRERETASSGVDRRCSNEPEDDKKEEDNEEEEEEKEEEEDEEEEEEQDGAYKIKEEEASENIRVVADEDKSGSMKSEFEGFNSSYSKGDDGAVQPPICSSNV